MQTAFSRNRASIPIRLAKRSGPVRSTSFKGNHLNLLAEMHTRRTLPGLFELSTG